MNQQDLRSTLETRKNIGRVLSENFSRCLFHLCPRHFCVAHSHTRYNTSQVWHFSLRVRMRYVAAYLLAVLGGHANPSADDIKKILGAVAAEVDDEKLNKLLGELKGKSLDEVLKAGREKLSAVPAAAPAAAAPAAAAAAPAAKEAPKKEEKPKEPSDEAPAAFDLFG